MQYFNTNSCVERSGFVAPVIHLVVHQIQPRVGGL